MKKEITQKEIKRLIRIGEAVDITNAPTNWEKLPLKMDTSKYPII